MLKKRLGHFILYGLIIFDVYYILNFASLVIHASEYNSPASDLPHEICTKPIPGILGSNQSDPQPTTVPEGETAVYLPGDLTTLRAETYTSDDIASPDPDDDFRVLIIPVGYSDVMDYDAHFGPVVDEAETVWNKVGLKVGYAYLNRSLPVPIYQRENHLSPDEVHNVWWSIDDLVWNKITNSGAYKFDAISFYVNSDAILSSTADDTPGRYQTIVGENSFNLYALIHETGHNLGLDDGYEMLRKIEEISSGQNSELFVDISTVSDHRRELLQTTNTDLVDSGLVCNGQTVYSPAGSPESIMNYHFENQDVIFDSGQVNPLIFTPYQIALMSETIEAK